MRESIVFSTSPFWRALRGEKISKNDWPAVLNRGEREGVACRLAALFPQNPGCGEIRKRTAVQHMVQTRLIRKISMLLGAEKIPWVLLKGMGLAHTIYDDPLGRQAGDCDVLVRGESLDRVAEIFRGAGFSRDQAHEELFISREGQIDVHTDIINSDRVSSRRLALRGELDWQDNIEHINIEEMYIPVLHHEANAAYLTIHLVHHHGLNGARWFIDLAGLLRKHPECARHIRSASRHGERLLYLLGYFLGDAAAANATARTRPPDLLTRFFITSLRDEIYVPGTRFLLTILDIPTVRGRASFIRQTVFPTTHIMWRVRSTPSVSPTTHHFRRLAETAAGWARVVYRTIGPIFRSSRKH